MYLAAAEPLLRQETGLQEAKDQSRIIKVFGPGESQVEDLLGEILDRQQDYGIALLAQEGEVTIKISVDDPDPEKVRQRLDQLCNSIVDALGPNVIGTGEDTLPGVVAKLLLKKGMSLAAVESCSGGLLSKMITDLPGSSKYFWGSVVSYSNQAKQDLVGVKGNTLQDYGAVSRETAVEMAVGIKNLSGVDIALSITGIAGPDGGSDEKPVGLVYIGLAYKDTIEVKEMRFVSDRIGIRTLAAKSALDLVRRYLLAEEGAK